MAGPLIGLAARAIAGLAGKKAAKQYAKGSGSRKAALSAETQAKREALSRSLQETSAGLKKLKKDMQASVKEQKIRQDAATKEATQFAKKLIDAGSKGSVLKGPGTKQ